MLTTQLIKKIKELKQPQVTMRQIELIFNEAPPIWLGHKPKNIVNIKAPGETWKPFNDDGTANTYRKYYKQAVADAQAGDVLMISPQAPKTVRELQKNVSTLAKEKHGSANCSTTIADGCVVLKIHGTNDNPGCLLIANN